MPSLCSFFARGGHLVTGLLAFTCFVTLGAFFTSGLWLLQGKDETVGGFLGGRSRNGSDWGNCLMRVGVFGEEVC